jgi:hypothetical protein
MPRPKHRRTFGWCEKRPYSLRWIHSPISAMWFTSLRTNTGFTDIRPGPAGGTSFAASLSPPGLSDAW